LVAPGTDDELIVDVIAIPAHWQSHGVHKPVAENRASYRLALCCRAGPPTKVWELHAKNRRLQRIEPEVRSNRVVTVLDFPPMLPNRAHLARKGGIGRRHEASIAERTQVLGWKKGEAPDRTKGTDRPVAIASADGLGGILDHRHACAASDLEDWRHVCTLTEQVNRQNRFRPGSDDRGQACGIDVVGRRIDVHEDRARPKPGDRASGRKERERSGDDLVAGPNSEGQQRRQQRISPRR
jgi:hypothetical protein